MSSLPQVATAVQHLLTTVAEQAARATGEVQRRRCFSGATWVQTLVFGCLMHPQPSLTELAQTAALLGQPVRPQAIAQRFTATTADCLAQVLTAAVETVISATPAAIPVLDRFTGVYVLDTSTVRLPPELAVSWPGCGNGRGELAGALKVGVRLDLRHGTLTGPELTTGRTHDRAGTIVTDPLPAGSLRLADLGFWSVTELKALSAQQVGWLSRLQAQTAVLDPAGERLDLDGLLATTGDDELELAVRLGAEVRVPARLLARRVPPDVAAARRRRLREEGTRRGSQPRRSRLDRCDWLLLVTNVPAERLSLAEAVVLARARWQIELLFKLWKSHGQLGTVRSADPWRVLAEVYATLIAMVMQHWVLVQGCWSCPARSLVKAATMLRQQAVLLLPVLGQVRRLCQTLTRVVRALRVAGRQNPRRASPNLYQLLLACEDAAPYDGPPVLN